MKTEMPNDRLCVGFDGNTQYYQFNRMSNTHLVNPLF